MLKENLTHLRGSWTEAEAQRYILLIFTAFNSWTEVKLNMKTLLGGGFLSTKQQADFKLTELR